MRDFDWERIRKNCRLFRLYASDDDPYVPLSKGRELAEMLGTRLEIVKGAGHFNEKAGYLEFDRLLRDVAKAL